MGSNLKIQQGSNGGWFIYKDGVLLLGSRDKDLLEKVKMFLENEDRLNLKVLERIAENKQTLPVS